MGTYRYTPVSSQVPRIPLISVQLKTPGVNNPAIVTCEAILDTGSDCTLVPFPFLTKVQAKIAGTKINIPVGGSQTIAVPYYVGFVFDSYNHPVFRVFCCPQNDIGEVILIGRDLMNQYRIEFDGINRTFTIF